MTKITWRAFFITDYLKWEIMKLFHSNHRYCRVLIRKSVSEFINLQVSARPSCEIGKYLMLLFLMFSTVGLGWGQTTYNLVTSTADLVAGSNYLIVNTTTNGTGYALGYQNTNNRPGATITVASNSISATPATLSSDQNNPYQITLGGVSGAWTLKDGVNNTFLSATASSNYLKNGAGTWNITFLANAVLMTCNIGTSNLLQNYSTLFSCYAGAQKSVYLYQAASPDYYWNGSNTSALNMNWNNLGNYWSHPSLIATLNAIWPASAGIYNANFNNATNATTVTIPGTIAYAPTTTNIGTNNYTFATTGSTIGKLASPINLNANTITLAPISTANLVLSGVISGTGGIAINGGGGAASNGGTLQLQGANSFSGATMVGNSPINAAILQLDAGATLTNSSVTISKNSQLYLNTSGVTYVNAGIITLNGNGNSVNAGAVKLMNPSVGCVWNGAVTLASNAGIFNDGATSTFKLAGVVSFGANTLTKTGTGALLLSNPGNTGYVGSSIVATGGIIQLAAANVIPDLTAISLTNAKLDINGFNETIGSVCGSGFVTNSSLTASVLTIGGDNTSPNFSGVIDGGSYLRIIKTGTGTQTLSGINTYSGSTTINGGTLAVTGSLMTGSAVTIAAGGTLAGTGTVSGSVAVYGTISPNTLGTIGTLSTGNLTMEGGGTYSVDINNVTGTAGTNWDQLIIGTLINSATIGSKFSIAINGIIAGFDINTTTSWVIGSYTGTAPSVANIMFTSSGTTAGYANCFSITFSGNNITLVYKPNICILPSAQATNMLFGTLNSVTIPFSFTAATGNSDGYLVIRTTTNIPPTNPTDATNYTVGTTALGGFIESVGNLLSVTSSSLAVNTSYWFWVFSYNNTNCSGGPRYFTATCLMGTATTTAPIISIDHTTLTGLNYNLGSGPSLGQILNLSATNLVTASGNITITGSVNYEVSKDNVSYGGTQTIGFTGFTLTTTPFYIRLKVGLDSGSYLGETIVVSGGGATSKSVICNGTVSKSQIDTALAQWDMSVLSGRIDTPFLTTSPQPIGVTISGLTRGVNVGSNSSGILRGWGGTSWSIGLTDPGASTGINFYFTIQVAIGYVASITAIPQFGYKRSSTGPTLGSLYYQINTGSFVLIGASGSLSFSSSSTSGANIPPIDLSGIAALQNLIGGTTVTIMIVPYNAYSSAGSWYIYDQGNTIASDFTLNGAIGCLPVMTNAVTDTSNFGTGATFALTASNNPTSYNAIGLPLGMSLNISTGVINILPTTVVGSYTITTSATNNYGTSVSSTLVYTVNPGLSIWVGTTADFNTASNWADNNIPAFGAAISIPFGTNYSPILSTNTTVGNLALANGASINLNGMVLTIKGAVTGTGTISSTSTSNIILSSTIGTIYFTTNSNTIQNLTLDSGSSVTIGNLLNVIGGVAPGVVTVGINTKLNSGGNLVIKSDSNGTARIAPSAGIINGNVTVERYITAKAARKFSYIGSAVTSSVRDSWQQQIYITGLGAGGVPCGITTGDGGPTDAYNSNGFDVTLNNSPSMYIYSPLIVNGSRYVGIANTESTNLSPGIGYILNIRGDRNSTTVTCANQLATGSPTSPEAVKLSATGIVTSGNISVVLNDITIHRYTLLSNPYPSQICFTTFYGNNPIINNKMWTYSPFGNNNYSTYSAGVMANGASGYDNTNNDCIASGQAFFVQANANGAVQFHENHKVNSIIPNTQYFGVNKAALLRVGFKTTSNTLLDEVVVRFNNNGTKLFSDAWDAESLSAASQTLSVIKQGKALAIATYSDTLATDTAQIGIVSNTSGAFYLSFSDYNFTDGIGEITLVDRFLGVNQDIRTNSVYNFNITSDTASKGKNRFYIAFSGIKALPVNITNINAVKIGEIVFVKWTIANEANISSYQIERSSDGVLYEVINNKIATYSRSYSINDINLPYNFQTLYYRIKAIGDDGSINYSPVVKVQNGNFDLANTKLLLYPNPVRGQLRIKLSNINSRIKSVRVYSLVGKTQLAIDNINAANNVATINVAKLVKGTFLIVVTDTKFNKLQQKFIKK